MTNLDKFYKLASNMLKHHATVTSSYDTDDEKYKIGSLSMSIGWWDILLRLDMLPLGTLVFLTNHNEDKTYIATLPEHMNQILDGLEYSYFDFLLEGIE